MNAVVNLATPLVAFVLYTNAAVVAVHYHDVPFVLAAGYVLLLLAPIARDLIFRGQPLVVTPALVSVLALFAVAVVGSVLAERPESSVKALREIALEQVLLYFLFLNAIRTPQVLKGVIWALIAAGGLMGAVVALQYATGAYDNEFFGFAQLDADGRGFLLDGAARSGAPRQLRLTGPIGEPNRFAQIMAVLVPLAALQVYASRRMARFAAAAALLAILLGGALAFSRGAAVGLALMLLAMVVMGYVRPRHLAVIGVGLLAVALVAPQYGRRLSSIANVMTLAVTGNEGGLDRADGSTQGRLTEMLAAVLLFADHPIVGAGPGMYREHYPEYARLAGGKVRAVEREAHSLPLQIAAEHGVLGLATFGMAIFFTFRDLGRARRRWLRTRPDMAHLCAALQLALVVYLTTGLFLHMSYARYFWFLFAVAGAAGQLQPQEEGSSALARLVRAVSAQRA